MYLEGDLLLSVGELSQMRRQVDKVLKVVSPLATVSLEGTPIYLNRPWDRTHEMGYNYILAFTRETLLARGNEVTVSVLLDDYSVESLIDPEDYLSRIKPPVDRIVREGEFVPQAEGLIAEIGSRIVTRSDGRWVALITKSGRASCPLLDAAFQETKKTAFNIVIRPSEFIKEQDAMRAILFAARQRLPSILINIFFKGRSINQVFITRPEEEMVERFYKL